VTRPGEHRIARRQFLRGVGATGVGVALAGAPGIGSVASGATQVSVYRLSTHGMDVCNACKGQGAHKYFRLRRYANHGRAHVGCNCRVLVQKIPLRRWKRFFVRPNGTLRNRWDDRW
jgi:hypothetical protein